MARFRAIVVVTHVAEDRIVLRLLAACPTGRRHVHEVHYVPVQIKVLSVGANLLCLLQETDQNAGAPALACLGRSQGHKDEPSYQRGSANKDKYYISIIQFT